MNIFENNFIKFFTHKHKLLLPYCVLGVFFIQLYRFQDYFIYTDFLSYYSVAKQYAIGNFYNAINAYWSPMLCWLLIPIVHFKNYAIQYMFLLNSINMVVLIYYTYKILKHYKLNEVIVQFALCTVSLYFLLFHEIKGPDPMVVTLQLAFFYYTINYEKIKQHKTLLGILGAIMYFTKAYLFYFFIAYLLFLFIKHLIAKKNIKELGFDFGKIFFIFLSISAVWIAIISYKYGYLLLNSVGEYAHAIAVPGDSLHGFEKSGLLDLPFDGAYSFNDEIATQNPHKDWSMFESNSMLSKQINIVLKNFEAMYGLSSYYNFTVLVFTLIASVLVISNLKKNFFSPESNLIAFTLLYLLGYAFVSFELRHIFWIYVFGIVLSSLILNRTLFIKYKYISYAIALLVFLICLRPLRQHFWKQPVRKIVLSDCQCLKTHIAENSNIAIAELKNDDIGFLVFKNENKFYGSIDAYKDSVSLWQAIKNKKINYIVLQDKNALTHFYFKNKKPTAVCNDKVVYSIH